MRSVPLSVYRSRSSGRWALAALLLATLLGACSTPNPPPPGPKGQAPARATEDRPAGRSLALPELTEALAQAEAALAAGDDSRLADLLGRLLQSGTTEANLPFAMRLRWRALRSAEALAAGQGLASAGILLDLLPAPTAQETQAIVDLAFPSLIRGPLSGASLEDASDALRAYAALSHQIQSSARRPYALSDQLASWQAKWPAFPLPSSLQRETRPAPVPLRVAVLLPFSGPLQSAGEALRDGLLSAQFENLQAGEPGAQLRFFDSAGAPLATVLAQALAFQPDHIIGPLTRDEVATLNGLAQGQETTTPPILALNRLPAATPAAVWSYALEPEEEGEQLAEQSWLQGHRRLLILHDQAPWAQRLASAAETRFERLGGEIAERQGFSATADLGAAVAAALLVEEGENRSRALRRLLRVPLETEPRRRQDIDGVLLIADPLPGQTLKSALAYYFAGDLPVWASSQVLAPEPSPTALKDLEAVTFALPPWRLHRLPGPAHPDQGAKPVPESPPPLGPLHALGADAWFLIHWQRGAAGALPFPGLTGQIANTEQPRRFSRHLSFAQLREGRFSPLAELAPLAPLTAAGQSETAPRLPAP